MSTRPTILNSIGIQPIATHVEICMNSTMYYYSIKDDNVSRIYVHESSVDILLTDGKLINYINCQYKVILK